MKKAHVKPFAMSTISIHLTLLTSTFWSIVYKISRRGRLQILVLHETGQMFVVNFGLILLCRKRAEIPIYSFSKHARETKTTSIYSPHVLILEGIFALYDPRVLQLLDMKVWCRRLSCIQCTMLISCFAGLL